MFAAEGGGAMIKKLLPGGKRVDYREKQRHHKEFNQRRQLKQGEYVSFYKSGDWRTVRQEVLDRDYGLCQRCGKQGNIVDHIIPSKDDWKERLNADNLQTLCKHCHDVKTYREWCKREKGAHRYMRINIVCGLPDSGKEVWVKQRLSKHDLVYDYDALMHTITGLPLGEINYDAHDYIMLWYEQMLRKLRTEQTFDNVWIILTVPNENIDNVLSPYHDVIKHFLVLSSNSNSNQFKPKRKANQKLLNLFEKSDFSKFQKIYFEPTPRKMNGGYI
ncbi:HNH endonuclease [Ligilactobacillus equi]|nr:HNH endonuclease [Ligilactobacillus equi]